MSEPTVPGELSAIHERLDAGDKRMQAIETQLNTNTDITRDIKEILDAGRLGLKVLGGLGAAFKWLGIFAAAATSIWGFIYLLTHGGVPPK